jgi:ParB-like nuclease domain
MPEMAKLPTKGKPDEAPTPKKQSWRDTITIHPAADVFPLMSEEDLRTLAKDIRDNGLQTPITVATQMTGEPNKWLYQLLDGRNRLDAIELAGFNLITAKRSQGRAKRCRLGMECGLDLFLGLPNQQKVAIEFISLDDPYATVASLNIHRRHLTAEEKRALTAKLVKLNPSKSNREIAKAAHVDHKTVAAVRARAESRGEIPHVSKRTDSRGRKQPAKATAKSPKVLSRDDVGPDSAGERARLIARITELENEVGKLKSEANRRTHPLDVEADKIAERCRKIRAFLDHPEQHVDTMRKLVAEILHAVDPEAKGAKLVSILSDKLDVTTFGRAMCLPTAGTILR